MRNVPCVRYAVRICEIGDTCFLYFIPLHTFFKTCVRVLANLRRSAVALSLGAMLDMPLCAGVLCTVLVSKRSLPSCMYDCCACVWRVSGRLTKVLYIVNAYARLYGCVSVDRCVICKILVNGCRRSVCCPATCCSSGSSVASEV